MVELTIYLGNLKNVRFYVLVKHWFKDSTKKKKNKNSYDKEEMRCSNRCWVEFTYFLNQLSGRIKCNDNPQEHEDIYVWKKCVKTGIPMIIKKNNIWISAIKYRPVYLLYTVQLVLISDKNRLLQHKIPSFKCPLAINIASCTQYAGVPSFPFMCSYCGPTEPSTEETHQFPIRFSLNVGSLRTRQDNNSILFRSRDLPRAPVATSKC